MNANQAQAIGERLTRVETLIEGMARQIGEERAANEALAKQVGELVALLNQAKGARITIGILFIVAGGIGGLITKYAPILLALPKA